MFMIFLQILIFRNMDLLGFINPHFYLLFILLLPFETPKWFILISSFLLGLSIDLFTNTIGMHAAASVFVAYSRPVLLQFLAPRDGYDKGSFPRMSYYGLWWFFRYAAAIVALHGLFFFFVEAFTFKFFWSTVGYSAANSVFTILLIVLSQFLIYKK
jgi:rod shape-determining protein MreD